MTKNSHLSAILFLALMLYACVEADSLESSVYDMPAQISHNEESALEHPPASDYSIAGVSEHPEYFERYLFHFYPSAEGDTVGHLITFRSVGEWGRGSENALFPVVSDSDGRLSLPGHSWPGHLRDPSTEADAEHEILIGLHGRNFASVISAYGVLSQTPARYENGFSVDLNSHNRHPESIVIDYYEKSDSKFWQWLMDEENAWRITVLNPGAWSSPLREETGGLWELLGVQVFAYAGDVTVISKRGILSQIPGFQADKFYFDLTSGGDFEWQYIMYHERSESELWRFFVSVIEEEAEGETVHPDCIRNRCDIPCQTMYIDGEHVPLCDIWKKYFFVFSDFQPDGEETPRDGFIITNWWPPEDTSPMWSQTRSSDMSAGTFILQNGRIVLNNDGGWRSAVPPRPYPQRIQINELTTTQWDDFGVQIFEYGGDVTLISLCGILSQMQEVIDDNFHFPLWLSDPPDYEHEVQYILYHELPDSSLWSLLMG